MDQTDRPPMRIEELIEPLGGDPLLTFAHSYTALLAIVGSAITLAFVGWVLSL